MLVYLDASVIVRALLTDEPEWERCAALLTDDALTPITATWTHIECVASVARAVKAKRTGPETVASVHGMFDGVIALVGHPPEQLRHVALEVVERHALTTLDAMHLAAALLIASAADETGSGLAFATVDGELAEAARAEGMAWPGEA